MYQARFGFEMAPFNNVPDTTFFYGSAKHDEALAGLQYAVQARKGFAVLTGEVGAGKTTISRALLRRLGDDTTTAVITNSRLSGVDLLYSVTRELGLEDIPPSRPQLLEAINEFLIDQLAEDRNVVLLIDEAQELPMSTLEEVRLISNLETEHEKLIQIILIGQPELRDNLERMELCQLRQRIAVRYHLLGLNRRETVEYINHRLQVAGPKHCVRFTQRAMNTIFRYSGGIPRLINLCCDKALLVAYTDDEVRIGQRCAMDAIREIEGRDFTFTDRDRTVVVQQQRPRRKPFIQMPFVGGRMR